MVTGTVNTGCGRIQGCTRSCPEATGQHEDGGRKLTILETFVFRHVELSKDAKSDSQKTAQARLRDRNAVYLGMAKVLSGLE